MGTRRKKSCRRSNKRNYSLIGSSYARRLRPHPLGFEALEDRRMLAVFAVDNLFDAGVGSLRQAIIDANNAGTFDEITFNAGVVGTINIVSQLPTITDNLTITGPGADLLTIDAGSTNTPLAGDGFRIFEINDGTAGLIDVSLSGLTLTGADVPHAPPSGSFSGGAIFNFETLTIDRTSIVANRARFGGGISQVTTASTTITNSTLSGNVASQNGGGVSNAGAFAATNVTISNNSADGGGGIILGTGPGDPNATLDLINSTVTGNTATNGSHGILFFTTYGPSTATFDHTIVNDAVVGVGGATTLSGSFNLFGEADPGITGSNNQFSTDPLLGPLADNGGPTETHALLPGSPAIDAGNSVLTTDQRGFTRPLDQPLIVNAPGSNGSDIGAYEFQELPSFVVTTAQDVVADDGVTSLREAINFANSQAGADTITFDAAVFTGGANSLIRLGGTELLITKSLTIDGSTGVDIVITADAAGDDITDGANITDVAASLTNDPTSLNDNSRVLKFSSTTGDLTLSNLTVTGGRTTGNFADGGGIYTVSGTVSLTSSTVSGNSTAGSGATGGGIRTFSGAVTLTSSTVSGNRTTGNFADGGGIFTLSGAVSLTSSTVSGNSTTGSGAHGGGIRTSYGAVTLTSSTVSGNAARGAGGGIYVRNTSSNPSFTIENSIVAGNTDNGGTPNDLVPNPDSVLTINHSLIGVSDNIIQTITGNVGNQTGTVASPLNPLLGPLQDNGGPTETHALLLGSPAIDAGDPTLVFNPTEFDQRGAPFARVLGNAIDIGAYEVQAVTQIVSTTDDVSDGIFSPGNLSLREAINRANTNPGADTITFSSLFDTTQTIALASQLPTITDDLTITGPGQTLLTLDAGNGTDDTFDTGDGFRILEIDNGDNGNLIDVEISGLTLTGGDVSGSFPGDQAGRGGAIRNLENLTLTASTLTGNATSGSHNYGGGIYHSQYAGTLDVTDTTISGNTSRSGGGINNLSTALVTIASSTISENTSSSSGGGIQNGDGPVTLTSSTISGNTSSKGGGIRTSSGDVTLNSSTVSGNTGGGIYTRSGDVTLNSSTVSGNTSSSDGGGIYAYEGAVTLTSSTVSGNTSSNRGGGIYTNNGDVTIQNSIVAGNMAGNSGPDLFVGIFGGTLTINHSLIGVADGLTITGNVGNQTGTAASPLNPLLGPLADNGGSTLPSGAVNQTHALLPGSPALDAITSLASGGVITQTTTHNASFPATNAVDGDLGTFSHTAVNDTNPHWQHNPTGGGRIYQIVLHNRQDGSQERLRDIRIEIFNGAEEVIFDSGLLNPNNVLISPAKIVVDVAALNGGAPVIGPFIRVSRAPDPNGTNDADKNVLSLAEVEIVSTAPGAPLFDQRGKLRIRDGGGNALARIDIGAYEAQAAPSADFDTDGDVDGFDFLAWQRGFGKANAQRADGNSDDDSDVDASDLAAWQVSFGQPQPLLLLAVQNGAVATSVQPAVSHAELRAELRAELFDPALIDAALALEWLGNDSDEETRYIAEQATLEAVFASGDELEGLAPTGSIASNSDAAIASSDHVDSPVDSTAERWLADELLERVFG